MSLHVFKRCEATPPLCSHLCTVSPFASRSLTPKESNLPCHRVGNLPLKDITPFLRGLSGTSPTILPSTCEKGYKTRGPQPEANGHCRGTVTRPRTTNSILSSRTFDYYSAGRCPPVDASDGYSMTQSATPSEQLVVWVRNILPMGFLCPATFPVPNVSVGHGQPPIDRGPARLVSCD